MPRLALILVAALTLAGRADILHLRDGSRHYGTLVSQNDREVVFRIEFADGASSVVKRFPATRVASVERGVDRPLRAHSDAQNAPASQPAGDFHQMLREAYELIDDGDVASALRALQRVVQRAAEDTLPQLDEHCRTARGLPLADLLATLRMRQALRGDGFRLKYATRYEARALSRLLEERCAALLAASYQTRTIADWATNPAEYAELQPDARQMVDDARRAAGMIGARIRFDPRLHGDQPERQRLVHLRRDLARFVAHVTSMRGYTSPTSAEATQEPPPPSDAPESGQSEE